jgi:hypothetical protein
MDDSADISGGAEPFVVVVVERTGGFAGLTRRWRAEADHEGASQWLPLLHACPWDAPARAERGADRFRWRVQAQFEGAQREARFGETSLVGPWQRLVDRVREDGEPC